MDRKRIKEIYDQVESLQEGVLYNTIEIIFNEEHSGISGKASEICNYFGICSNSCREDDLEIINGYFPVNQIEKDMEWIIIVGAFALIGSYFVYNQSQKLEPRNLRSNEVKEKQSPLPIPAALCLIVPANVISNFSAGSSLSNDDLIYLIDNTSYFLCTHLKRASSFEEALELTDEVALLDSKQEFYIKIKIDDGRHLIDQKTPYALKTNLPDDTQSTVEKLACLDSLSGLEVFNRI